MDFTYNINEKFIVLGTIVDVNKLFDYFYHVCTFCNLVVTNIFPTNLKEKLIKFFNCNNKL